jgi:Undecaprenyl-phosphate galactose phosphotransferase WbaP
VSSVNRINPSTYLFSDDRSSTRTYDPATRGRMRARICSVSLVSGDLLAFALATFLAFAVDIAPRLSPYARAIGNLRTLGVAWHGWGSLLVLVCLLSYFGGRGHYTSRVPAWTQVVDVVIATAIAMACDVFLTVAIYEQPVLLEGLLRWVLLGPCLLLSRAAIRQILRATGLWSLRTLIMAPPSEIETARAALMSDATLGYTVVGAVAPVRAALLSDEEWLDLLAERGADFGVIAVGSGEPRAEQSVLSALRRTGLPIALVPALRGMPVAGFRQHYFLGHDIVMLENRDNLVRPGNRVIKTAFDQIGAAILVVLLTPLMLMLAAMVRAEGGPTLYRHRRVGTGGREFECLKFRTMVLDADRILRQVLARDASAAAEWNATQKLRDDPRITKIGRFLRRSSLDELPQLFNVLRGEMSLVGPRPIVRSEVRHYGESIEHYYAARPGLTGLWQVSGRSDTSYEGRVKLDVWYVRNWTLWHDIAILFRTIPAVFLRRGAL